MVAWGFNSSSVLSSKSTSESLNKSSAQTPDLTRPKAKWIARPIVEKKAIP